MQHFRFKNSTIEVECDEQGYLIYLKDWSEDIAKELAKEEDIELSSAHWEIIYIVRNFYIEFNISPTIRMLVKIIEHRYGMEHGNSRYLFRLFPKGPAKQATKIAGLPKPVQCL
ncbi:TusE/DsrC/DsvC family sulfur relay protein [Candidatus Erwinia haradaeae]|uniref:Sulfurtransferase n=1 Tax=Candidatus Erwinia haradaeae TaxID=1922217 RepID=A0A451D280_9GAMM|nr:TusE/DsrC/DsvC family sulfur relay protein [Candidatus Erwinia haradaeae]VFP79740.1 Sulfurtransferase TusE [Candidatus Erwinia haradaeae]